MALSKVMNFVCNLGKVARFSHSQAVNAIEVCLKKCIMRQPHSTAVKKQLCNLVFVFFSLQDDVLAAFLFLPHLTGCPPSTDRVPHPPLGCGAVWCQGSAAPQQRVRRGADAFPRPVQPPCPPVVRCPGHPVLLEMDMLCCYQPHSNDKCLVTHTGHEQIPRCRDP